MGRPTMLRRVLKALGTGLILALVWLVWPQSMHGRVAYISVDGHSMDGTYANGDLIVVRKQPSYNIGDIVTYRIPKGEFGAGANVIHRITGGNGTTGFTTQGDNRNIPDPWHPRTADIVGHSELRVPGGARYFLALSKPIPLGGLCAGLTVLVMLWPKSEKAVPRRKPKHARPSPVFGYLRSVAAPRPRVRAVGEHLPVLGGGC
ncbi:MAG: signal peptidase [Frankiales bacterium]|jgi:signal peptidase|nr:signal peptidase [Frankiales bacterium]